jgi:hypothetical protein
MKTVRGHFHESAERIAVLQVDLRAYFEGAIPNSAQNQPRESLPLTKPQGISRGSFPERASGLRPDPSLRLKNGYGQNDSS